jgi:hypothetical protein
MIRNYCTDDRNGANGFSCKGLWKLSLLMLLLAAVVITAGCGGLGKPDAKFAGSWIMTTSKSFETGTQVVDVLTLRADGTYERTMEFRPMSRQSVSGKWGVNGDQLNLRQDKVGATMESFACKLNDKGDQLQLTKDGLGGGVAIPYRKTF